MSKILHRVLVAVPVANRILAGKEYAKHTKDTADDDSFTAGFFDAQSVEWAVACWAIDKQTVGQFDALLAAYPQAKVAKWDDSKSDAETELARIGLARRNVLPTVQQGGKAEAVTVQAEVKAKG